jgi:hypothetical protein
MFIDKFKILASIAEAVKKVVDEEDVEESGLRKAAYAAHSAGQSHFKFKGKTYPVKITKEHVDEMKESAEHDLQEGDAPSDYPTTARAANAASKTAKSKKEHAKASDLHTRAAYYALSDGRDASVVRDHQMTAHEHSRAAKGLKEATGVTDYNPPSQGGTRKELTAKYHKTKDPKDAEAARKAGATQNELKGKLSEEEIKESDPLRARYSLPVTTVPYGYKRDWSPEGARKRQLRPDKNVPELKNAIKNTLGQHGPKGKLPEEEIKEADPLLYRDQYSANPQSLPKYMRSTEKRDKEEAKKNLPYLKTAIKMGKGQHGPKGKLPEESNLDDESPIAEVKQPTGGLKKACWKGYTAVGMKSKGGRMVPNCVPEEVEEDASIDEKAVNPYAVGMAAAKKSAGVTKTHDLPKSVITKGHEIAKKIIKKG